MSDSSASQAPIRIDGLSLSRSGRTVLSNLSLSVEAGQAYALLGGNGAGKSTTIAALLGLLPAEGGVMEVAGIDPVEAPEAARRVIGYLPENVALYEQLDAYENIAYFLALGGARPSRAAIDEALDAAGLEADARRLRTADYSKGMRQKVAIAMALLRDVPVLLLDEPTSGLDPRATADFNALVRQLKARGTAILMVTHDLLGAADCADLIGFLAKGRIVEEVATGPNLDVMALHHRYGEAAAA
ncbi:ABC transporter ATP-binding protein [Alteraurantiacibacter aquimixticola]|uniref:ABC transporter ATP-binding protein n=1 Tax=Alteraurantiacibacter aquimixticola TaxID=2489173 RepID=A0A4T3F5K9_9SPHN|nr:ABC transporter ATP-binding protein [Alteraurantiacibacter aquimixticola]TIX51674.1 ABC transporter ATP-binding protein [Alteraurantiacibacter aquimixticola]